jgi:ATP-dependent helicase/nuclease subunit A
VVDPPGLALEVEEHAALRHQRILEVDPDKLAAAESEQDYAAWKNGQTDLLSRASQPSICVQTVTALARSEASQQLGMRAPIEVEMIGRGDFERPSGRRFGSLVHAILASVDLDAESDAIQASAAINGRLVGATEEEINAAVVAVRATLRHPLLRSAAGSATKGELRRETPVLIALDDGSLVEGVVDLAFKEDTPDFVGWTVIDFKTDREFATSSDQYKAQVSVYSEAIGKSTGSLSRGVPMVV